MDDTFFDGVLVSHTPALLAHLFLFFSCIYSLIAGFKKQRNKALTILVSALFVTVLASLLSIKIEFPGVDELYADHWEMYHRILLSIKSLLISSLIAFGFQMAVFLYLSWDKIQTARK